MSLPQHYQLMARYNQRLNTQVYDAAARLSHEALALDRGAYFSSIIGTLNHILVGDTIWLRRFSEHPAHFSNLQEIRKQTPPDSLDQVLHSQLPALTEARRAMDVCIINFSLELDDTAIAQTLCYSNTRGEPFRRNFGLLLQHFFNHQTHHRGQVSTLLSQSGIDIGTTDLLAIIPLEE